MHQRPELAKIKAEDSSGVRLVIQSTTTLPLNDRYIYMCLNYLRPALPILAISWIEDANFQTSGVHNFPLQLVLVWGNQLSIHLAALRGIHLCICFTFVSGYSH